MREIEKSWGSATKVAWSIGWRLVLYVTPAYLLGYALVIVAIMAGESAAGWAHWVEYSYLVLQALWVVFVALAMILAVRGVIGKSFSRSSFPPVREDFRITLVSDGD